MRDLLAAAGHDALRSLALARALLAFDFDGTLAPIVNDPALARMRPITRELLERAARLYPVVVITGRSQEDAMRLLRGIAIAEVIGNHGLAPWRRSEFLAARVARWVHVLRADLGCLSGVVIEDKVFSVAIHYRGAMGRKRAREAIVAAAARMSGVRVVGGKCVVNLLPEGSPHKGLALQGAWRRLRCETALYVGDDEGDEDVFALDDPGRLVPVRVGARATSRAAFFLKSQQCIDDLLTSLIGMRAPAGSDMTLGARSAAGARRASRGTDVTTPWVASSPRSDRKAADEPNRVAHPARE